MRNLRGPGYVHRPVRAHVKSPIPNSSCAIRTGPQSTVGTAGSAPLILSRGDKIEQNIELGRYECGICCDEDINREDVIWYCQTCWTVYHLQCITRVAVAATTDTELADEFHLVWKCPTCRSEYAGSPWELCCKSKTFGMRCIIVLKARRVQEERAWQSRNYHISSKLMRVRVSEALSLWTHMPQGLPRWTMRSVSSRLSCQERHKRRPLERGRSGSRTPAR